MYDYVNPLGPRWEGGGEGMAQWGELLPFTSVARTLGLMGVEFVVGSRPCPERFFWVLRFSFLLKNQHFQIPI